MFGWKLIREVDLEAEVEKLTNNVIRRIIWGELKKFKHGKDQVKIRHELYELRGRIQQLEDDLEGDEYEYDQEEICTDTPGDVSGDYRRRD